MKFTEQDIKGVWLIEPVRYGDARGYFCETFRQDDFDKAVGRHVEFIQDNESFSTYGVVRGLHYQQGPYSQAKLVRVSLGEVLDVAVDLRRSSPTFGRYMAVVLSADRGNQLFVPRGFAHGFAVLSETAQFQYKVDNLYHPEAEVSIRYDDPAIGVDWQIAPEQRLLSPKDLKGISFATAPLFD